MCLWPAQASVHTELFSVQQDYYYPDQINITATSNVTDRVFALAEVGNVIAIIGQLGQCDCMSSKRLEQITELQ